MPTRPGVRPAGAADVEAIRDIYAGYVLTSVATFEEEPPPVEEMRRRWQGLADAGHPFVVATLEDRVVGYAYARPYRTRSAYRFTVEDSVYVAPHAHRQGVGRALLEAIVAACAAQGRRQMLAVIGGGMDNQASVALHRACGFALRAVLPGVGYKHGRWVDSVVMQRALGPPVL